MIEVYKATLEEINFPAGEPHIRIHPQSGHRHITVLYSHNHSDDLTRELWKLALIADAIKRAGLICHELIIEYMPFGRQDRIAEPGDAFSLKVACDFINSMGFETITLYDPHSDVTTALLNNVRVLDQAACQKSFLEELDHWNLVIPDAGAIKKAMQIAKRHAPDQIIQCHKDRDPKTGEITSTYCEAYSLNQYPFVICDDICDGGRTFIEIAKVINEHWADRTRGNIILSVTHGMFTKGFEPFEQSEISEIYVQGRKAWQRKSH